MWRVVKFLLRAALATAVALAAGFVVFVASLHRSSPSTVGKADGIVVLTGGEDRIGKAIQLLADGHAKRLLISGVNRRTTRKDLMRRMSHAHPEDLFTCCIDIDYARDTSANASETRIWAQANRFRKLIVVTSSYHMPRSLTELYRVLPEEVKIVPYAVVPRSLKSDGWWLDKDNARLLLFEYAKYLPLHGPLRHGSLYAPGHGRTNAGRSIGLAGVVIGPEGGRASLRNWREQIANFS